MASAHATRGYPVGYGVLIRGNPDFRQLWFGQIVSLLGDWFNLIASASLVGLLTESGFAVGGLFVVRMLAPFLVSPITGVVADRFNRKRILILADLLRAVTVCGFLLVRDPGDVWLLYALTAIQLGVGGFFYPARNAILPDLVSPEELGAANMLSSVTWSVMLALGAALGGLVAGVWGNYPAFVVDAITFLVSAAFVAGIRYERRSAAEAGGSSIGAALQQYLDGLRYLGRHADILVVALHKAAIALTVWGGFSVVQVVIAEQVFVIGEGGGVSLGLMYGVAGIGSGIGPVLARRFTGDRDRALRVAILLGYGIAAAGMFVIAPLASLEVVLLGTFVRSIGAGMGWVLSTQLLLQLAPTEVRGRVFSTEIALFSLTSAAAAAAVGGSLDTALGISGVLLSMAVLTIVAGVLWGVWLMTRRSGERPAMARDE